MLRWTMTVLFVTSLTFAASITATTDCVRDNLIAAAGWVFVFFLGLPMLVVWFAPRTIPEPVRWGDELAAAARRG
jgi:hypothetical protein